MWTWMGAFATAGLAVRGAESAPRAEDRLSRFSPSRAARRPASPPASGAIASARRALRAAPWSGARPAHWRRRRSSPRRRSGCWRWRSSGAPRWWPTRRSSRRWSQTRARRNTSARPSPFRTCAGFLLTMVTIRLMPMIADAIGWRWTFLVLAPGPILGAVAMTRLRRLGDEELAESACGSWQSKFAPPPAPPPREGTRSGRLGSLMTIGTPASPPVRIGSCSGRDPGTVSTKTSRGSRRRPSRNVALVSAARTRSGSCSR